MASKSSIQLFRDCLRLVNHIAGDSPKGVQMRQLIANEFRRNKDETDPQVIEDLKFRAVRGLSNYLLFDSASNDPAFKERIQQWERTQSDAMAKKKGSSNAGET